MQPSRLRARCPPTTYRRSKQPELDGLLLSNKDLNEIAGADPESFYSTDEMNDKIADLVSGDRAAWVRSIRARTPPATEVTGQRNGDELLIETGAEDDAHLVEQTVVLFDTADEAVQFFEMSKDIWRDCAQTKDVMVEGGPWVPDDVQEASERMITQKAEVSGTIAGICQHALGVVSNLDRRRFFLRCRRQRRRPRDRHPDSGGRGRPVSPADVVGRSPNHAESHPKHFHS